MTDIAFLCKAATADKHTAAATVMRFVLPFDQFSYLTAPLISVLFEASPNKNVTHNMF